MSQKKIDHAIRTTFRNPPILASEDRAVPPARGARAAMRFGMDLLPRRASIMWPWIELTT
jgi:hypothetical protein